MIEDLHYNTVLHELYLGPGAVLPALKQTVPMAGLPGTRFDRVSTGTSLHSLTLSLRQAVLHTPDIEATVA